ncbi:MAG: CoA-binding protein [Cyclobacteriaceae bacterium]
MKKTLIVGASPNPARYAYLAVNMLLEYGHPIVPIGIKSGEVAGHGIVDLRQRPVIPNINTVTLYLNPYNQEQWHDYLIALKPVRIIFNPGTENNKFALKAQSADIETIEACTLVMLRSGTY